MTTPGRVSVLALHKGIWEDAPKLPKAWCPVLQEALTENDSHAAGKREPILIVREHEQSNCKRRCEVGKVLSPLYESVKLAVTVPEIRADLSRGYRESEVRVPRPAPGEVECSDAECVKGRDRGAPGIFACRICGGLGTVSGTDEASAVARRQGCGLLLVVYVELLVVGSVSRHVYDTGLLGLLLKGDYGGACKVIAELLKVVVKYSS